MRINITCAVGVALLIFVMILPGVSAQPLSASANPANPSHPYCGDNVCQSTESVSSCALDCRLPALTWTEVNQFGTLSSLRYAACPDASCSSLSPVTLSFTGSMAHLRYTPDNLPLIVFVPDTPSRSIYAVKCQNVACTQRTYTPIVDATPEYVNALTLSIMPTGNPLIAYVRGNTPHDQLVFYFCADFACTSGTSRVVYDGPSPHTLSGGSYWFNVSFRKDGKPLAAIGRNSPNGPQATLISCADLRCTTTSSTIISETSNIVESAVGLRSEGYPVIAANDLWTGTLSLVQCTDRACNGRLPLVTLADAGSPIVGMQPQNGFPEILYRFWTLPQIGLEWVLCQTRDCSQRVSRTITSLPAELPSFIRGGDGNPLIFYHDYLTGNLRLVQCLDSTCASSVDMVKYHSPLPANALLSLSADR